MSSTVLYDITVPLFVRQLENLLVVLKKGEDWCEKNNVDKNKLIEGKLAEDMLPLTFQVQTCSNTSKGILHRIGGAEEVPMEDNEKTFLELYARIEKTIDVLKKAKKETFVSLDTPTTVKLPSREINFQTALQFLQNFAFPNFFFHMTTAYAILRNAGVDVGKLDYLGGATMTQSFQGPV